jgi:SAM-dependent methyltransferase
VHPDQLALLDDPDLDLLEGELARGAPELPLLDRLRKKHTPEHSRVLLEQALLNLKARQRGVFRTERRLALNAEALEQASCWEVAAHRAEQLHERAPAGLVLDLGCGAGGDSLELARLRPVLSIDLDPERVALLAHNARQLELTLETRQGDWLEMNLPEAAAAFVDPGRRQNGRRIFDPEQYQPPLSRVLQLRAPLLCVKVAPGIPDVSIPAEAETEFISHQGSCKECVLWIGVSSQPGLRRASVFVDGMWLSRTGNSSEQLPVEPLQPGMWLHEPDPAMIRAHALGSLAEELAAGLLDSTLAYLVGPPDRRSPLAQSFEVIAQTTLRREAIQTALDEQGWGQLEIKKRGVDIEPEAYRKKLKIRGKNGPGVLVLTRVDGRHSALLCRRIRRS